jgi:hypothetical protein
MDNITISMKALARLTEKSKAELVELLTINSDDAENTPTQGDIDAKVIEAFSPKFQKLIKDTKGRSAKEILQIKEKELAEKYGVSKTSDLITLVEDIVTKQVGNNSTKEISKDEAKREKQINLFLSQFDSNDYEVKADGSIVVLENGKARQDTDYNDITVSRLVNDLNLFDISNDTGKAPTQNPPKGGDNAGSVFTKEDVTTNFHKTLQGLSAKGDLKGIQELKEARKKITDNN